ncbi:MAG: hypothetical protein KKD46_03550 [Euryarchaeota archaeon]|nr:hypothetical protein [Euryarchaeota archaeon]MBU4339976.1 hypothetical protein [Euryarchaeota archaeon]MCG2735211.1 hypothetical protein [Candidatus Methanoperedenaceae archaeon]
MNADLKLCLKKSQARYNYHSLNINPAAQICPLATASYQNESIQVTGMPHHTKAPSGSPVFSIAAAGALRGYAFRSLDVGGGGTVGFGAGGGLGFVFLGGV